MDSPANKKQLKNTAISEQTQGCPPAGFWLIPDTLTDEHVGRKSKKVPDDGHLSNPNLKRKAQKSSKKKVLGGGKSKGRAIQIGLSRFSNSRQGDICSKPLTAESQTLAAEASQAGKLSSLDGKLLCECGERVCARRKPSMDGPKGGQWWPTTHSPKKFSHKLANPSGKPGYYKPAP